MLKKYPKLKSAQMFELLAKDVLERNLGITLSQYGRQGQAQHGIDLYTSGNPRRVVQCKDYLMEKSLADMRKTILDEVLKTQKLNFAFAEFWMATSLDRDTQIQNMVENINESQNMRVYILFWDDIEICLSSNPAIACKYYQEYFPHHLSLIEDFSTAGSSYIPSNNLMKMSEVLGFQLSQEENRENSKVINTVIESLTKIPTETRYLLAIMVARSYTHIHAGCIVPLHEVAMVAGIDNIEIGQQVEILHRNGITSELDIDDQGCPICILCSDSETGWAFWNDIRDFCRKSQIPTQKICVEIDFSVFDIV